MAHVASPDQDIAAVEPGEARAGVVESRRVTRQAARGPQVRGEVIPDPVRVGRLLLGLPLVPHQGAGGAGQRAVPSWVPSPSVVWDSHYSARESTMARAR